VRQGSSGWALICRTSQPEDEAGSAPKLNVVPIDKTFGLVDCLGIVSAKQPLETHKVTVNPNGVRPVLCHPHLSNQRMPGRHRPPR